MKRLIAAAFLVLAATPGTALAWWNNDWDYRQQITVNGAQRGVTEEVDRAPVLVRLHGGVIDFANVKDDGSDLRFVAGDDKTPLNFHVERFDKATNMALVWVDMPDIAPAQAKTIWLYYGNQKAAAVGKAAATYDANQSLVLHFSETAGAPVDATANANRVIALTARPAADGLIAGAMSFAETSELRVAPSQSLAPAKDGLTWSGWVRLASETAQPEAAVFTKHAAAGPGRLMLGVRGGAPFVRLVSDAGAATEAVSPAAFQNATWAHVAVTSAEGVVRLYVNGAETASLPGQPGDLAGELILGAADGLPSFAGELDEAGFANTARSPSEIALAAGGQGRSSTLVGFDSEPELKGAGGHNYFGVLLAALTPDAWAVIAILAVLAGFSWWVMYTRHRYVSRAAKANDAFLQDFARLTRGAEAGKGLPSADPAVYGDAPIYRMYAVGADQTRAELSTEASGVLSGKSVDVIRAALSSQLSREVSQLHKAMVVLTIAISGGPFLGLLGTVVGVMITFAAIAAAGDVNINAIAPGIAAALLATVAGLAVAIPALFGYNYLITRIQDVTAQMEVFVDEFSTKIAKAFG